MTHLLMYFDRYVDQMLKPFHCLFFCAYYPFRELMSINDDQLATCVQVIQLIVLELGVIMPLVTHSTSWELATMQQFDRS